MYLSIFCQDDHTNISDFLEFCWCDVCFIDKADRPQIKVMWAFIDSATCVSDSPIFSPCWNLLKYVTWLYCRQCWITRHVNSGLIQHRNIHTKCEIKHATWSRFINDCLIRCQKYCSEEAFWKGLSSEHCKSRTYFSFPEEKNNKNKTWTNWVKRSNVLFNVKLYSIY